MLRERLAQILFLFHENAADLFPQKVHHQGQSQEALRFSLARVTLAARVTASPSVRTPVVFKNLDPECFPEQMEGFAADIADFLKCLNEFPEFADEQVRCSIFIQ